MWWPFWKMSTLKCLDCSLVEYLFDIGFQFFQIDRDKRCCLPRPWCRCQGSHSPSCSRRPAVTGVEDRQKGLRCEQRPRGAPAEVPPRFPRNTILDSKLCSCQMLWWRLAWLPLPASNLTPFRRRSLRRRPRRRCPATRKSLWCHWALSTVGFRRPGTRFPD